MCSFRPFQNSTFSFSNKLLLRCPFSREGTNSAPKRVRDRKGEERFTTKCIRHGLLNGFGIHTGTFAVYFLTFFSNYFTFILGSPFLLPQRANNQKREFSKLQRWMKQRGFSARGIQTGPFASCWVTFLQTNFQLFPLSYWGAHSYYRRGPIIRKGNSPNSRDGWNRGVSVHGAFKQGHLHPVESLLFIYFCNFYTFILGGPFLITPEGQ